MEHEVKYENGIAVVRVWGKAVAEGYAAVTAAIVSLPEWQPGTPILVDFEDLDLTEASVDDIRTFASAPAKYRKELGHCLCAVVNSKLLDFGLARMWQAFMTSTTDVEVGVFYTVADAMNWLHESMARNR